MQLFETKCKHMQITCFLLDILCRLDHWTDWWSEARGKAERPGELCGSTDKLEEDMPKLDGKIAVITGGNSGIGLATAKVFVKEGARVYFTGRRQAELDAATALLGPSATPVQGDVSKPADVDRLYAQIHKEVGRVDVVFANAGAVMVAPPRQPDGGAHRLSPGR